MTDISAVTNFFCTQNGIQEGVKIERSFAEDFKRALKTVGDFNSQHAQFMSMDDFNSLVQSNIFFFQEGLFGSNAPEDVLNKVLNKSPGWISNTVACVNGVEERIKTYNDPNLGLAGLKENAPNGVRLVLDFLAESKRGSPSQARFFNSEITDEKLASVSHRTDFSQEDRVLNPEDEEALHSDFQAWLIDRVNRQNITATTLIETSRSMQDFFTDINNFKACIGGVNRLTSSYLASIQSGEVSNESSVALYQAQQLVKDTEAETEQKQILFEQLKAPSQAFVQALIDKHGQNYLLRNKSAGKDNVVSVTDKGAEPGRVKTYTRTAKTAQLTNMTLQDLKERVDSGKVVIVSLEQKSGFQKITLDEFKPFRSLEFYNEALSSLEK